MGDWGLEARQQGCSFCSALHQGRQSASKGHDSARLGGEGVQLASVVEAGARILGVCRWDESGLAGLGEL